MDIRMLHFGIYLLQILTLIVFHNVGCCTFPSSWEGTWYSSRRGDLNINSTTIDSINTTLTGPLQYSCFLNSGNTYIIRSELITLHNSLHRVYFCLEMWTLTKASVAYYHKTSANPQAYNERMKVYPAISSVTLLDLCDFSPSTTSWEVLVKQGSTQYAAVNCPNSIRGVYNYTITLSSTTSCGLNSSSLDVCLNTTQPTINTSLCSTPVAYSNILKTWEVATVKYLTHKVTVTRLNINQLDIAENDGLLQCILTKTVNLYSYTIVLNLDAITDEMTTYRFTCLVSEVSGDYTYVSQYPQRCQSSQTPTSSPAGGGTLILLPSRTCPSGSPELSKGHSAVLLLLSLTLLLFLFH